MANQTLFTILIILLLLSSFGPVSSMEDDSLSYKLLIDYAMSMDGNSSHPFLDNRLEGSLAVTINNDNLELIIDLGDFIYYKQSFSVINWRITNETLKILDYKLPFYKPYNHDDPFLVEGNSTHNIFARGNQDVIHDTNFGAQKVVEMKTVTPLQIEGHYFYADHYYDLSSLVLIETFDIPYFITYLTGYRLSGELLLLESQVDMGYPNLFFTLFMPDYLPFLLIFILLLWIYAFYKLYQRKKNRIS
ncbi:MAG: hypothetical protein INQ03_14010 [Candidatus Heimdallarchaeota archaeon]|nr:hypothetical protein [Candidatus Heimdallarchaeota archaeon]